MLRFLTVSSAALLSLCASDLSSRVDQIFAEWDKTSSPGCALAVIQDGRILYKHGYGMADLNHDIAIAPSSVFHVASVSKQFVAASIVLLAQRGKLNYDDPANKYIPELPTFNKPVTIRHLLHHVSGIRDQWSLLTLAGWRLSEDVVRDEDILDLVSRMKELNFDPGERLLYSNTNYTLLAQIVKRVSGKDLRTFTHDEIFEPLGMHSTHFRDDHREIVKGLAYGYESRPGGFRESIPHYDTVGASSLVTNVEDLALWQRNFEDPKVGGKALVEAMLQPFTLKDGTKTGYRFGLMVSEYRGLKIVEHDGADAGYRASLVRFPDEKLSVACLCNGPANAGVLARNAAEVYLADRLTANPPRHPSQTPLTPTEAKVAVARAEYVGRYYSEEIDSTYEVKFDHERLIVYRKKSRTHTLEPGALDTFGNPTLGTLRFEREPSGRISGFRLSNGRVLNLRFVRQGS